MAVTNDKSLIFTDTDTGGIIHIANIKGGVGKSTVATNLAAALSKKGPTLIIDLDVQGSATVALGHDTDTTEHLSSWELLQRRFCGRAEADSSEKLLPRMHQCICKIEKRIFGSILGSEVLTSLVVSSQPGLDLIPAGADLFKSITHFQLSNLIYNLSICREYYKYIVIDTPSVWNNLTRTLYLSSDLNLIPVTLNALSTKSLRDYLSNVRALAQKNPHIRLRIIKNEVFGKQDSKLVGKTRTMSENRKFLENLCEQVTFVGSSGVSLLPQSIIFDLEIPESATVRNAQDEGKSVFQYQHYGKVSKAFDELAKRVQYVLNTLSDKNGYRSVWQRAQTGVAIAACFLSFFIVGFHKPIGPFLAERPVAPQQLIVPTGGFFTHTFNQGESLHKLAKYAICRFRAAVPSWEEVDDYVNEVVTIYNLTRNKGETKITRNNVPAGNAVTFYPPVNIYNSNEKLLVPVYNYFIKSVDDPFAYVTGDWCERGTGGGQPHYGIDVAAGLGSKIYAPMHGTASVAVNNTAGRMVGIVSDGMVLFFCHMDKRFFEDGDPIKQGDVLGTVGMTGRTSGPHVHIGYGIKTQGRGDMKFARAQYRVTDPKLFFYRKMYLDQID